MGVPLSDLVNPDQLARLRGLAGSGSLADDAVTGAAEVKSAPAVLEVKGPDDASPGIEHKAAPAGGGAQVLSADDETGIVEALVSVTGVQDRVKDIIEPGAYTKTLAKREPIGVWSHDDKTWVARTESARELLPGDPFFKGLKTMDGEPWDPRAGAVHVKARFNLDTPHGKAAYSDVKFFQGKTGWSIGYRATKASRDPRTGVRNIKELDWFEYSPVMVGAASQPMTLSVKSLAQPVDAEDASGLVDDAVLEQLSETELDRFTELKTSLGLEVKDIVRTPAGARRYGQPIGTKIVHDKVPASALKVGDHVDFQGMGPGGPSDPVKVSGKVDKVKHDGRIVTVTVDGKDHKLTEGSPINVARADGAAPHGGAAPAGVSPAFAGAIKKVPDAQLDVLTEHLSKKDTPDAKAQLAAVKAEKARRAGGAATAPVGSNKTPTAAASSPKRATPLTKSERAKAADALGLDTLDTRNSDSHDFHEVNLDALTKVAESIYGGKLPDNLTPAKHPDTADEVATAHSKGGSAADFPEFHVAAIAKYLDAVKKAKGGSGDKPAGPKPGHYVLGSTQFHVNEDGTGWIKQNRHPIRKVSAADVARWEVGKKADDADLEQKALAHENLNRSPKVNWVERAGQLPAYIQHIAKDIHKERGIPLNHAIPIAISRVKKWAAGGDNVKPDTRAKAAKAVAEWEALKAKAHAKFDSEVLEYLERKQAELNAAIALLADEGILEVKDDAAEPVEEAAEPDDEEDVLDLGSDDLDLVDELLAGALSASEADTAAAAAAELDDADAEATSTAELAEAKGDDVDVDVDELRALMERADELKSWAEPEEPDPFV